ncbi:MAG TPA: hypothetical protein PKZ00_07710 [Elusimicrobiota bacterium]|nr:hypothetical protein [Elusimicrobiota bacterium]HMX94643.1 hypothetical protein [Elusimicrobiota bacterium]HMZ25907.1 hypothetical protein [Elusimicrobiota bacterium]HNA60338.1 hypothetical protein [Elusimicrobiota bacterium]HND65120.1 hypothetical protein [Elusimicrobiota bacterium]
MKRLGSLLLAAAFALGVFALPGKVCPAGASIAVPDSTAKLPPCHRAASSKKRPCGAMVCCLVPEAERSFTPAPVPAAPAVVWNGRVETVPVSPFRSVNFTVESSVRPPPGQSAGFLLAFSLRAPPTAA